MPASSSYNFNDFCSRKVFLSTIGLCGLFSVILGYFCLIEVLMHVPYSFSNWTSMDSDLAIRHFYDVLQPCIFRAREWENPVRPLNSLAGWGRQSDIIMNHFLYGWFPETLHHWHATIYTINTTHRANSTRNPHQTTWWNQRAHSSVQLYLFFRILRSWNYCPLHFPVIYKCIQNCLNVILG